MATKISEYSSTPASNTDLDGINLSENVMVPSDVNDALRMQMAHLKDLDTGASALTSPEFASATMTGDLNFGTNNKATFGSGDLQIYHDGTDSVIKDTGTGNLVVTSNGGGIFFRNNEETETYANFNNNGSVQLRHNNATKFETTASGIDVTGGIDFSSGILASNGSVQFVMDKDNNGGEVFLWGHNASNATTNELMRLTSAGSLGIGTSSPASALHISANTYPQLEIDDKASRNYAMGVTASTFRIRDVTGAADRLTIDPSGNAGIGTVSPDRRLQIKSDENNAANTTIGLAPSTTENVQGGLGVGSGGILGVNAVNTIQFRIGGADGDGASEVARIGSDGRVGIGTASPLGKFMVKDGTSSPSALVVRQTSEAGAATLSLDSIFNNANNTDKEVASIKLGVVTNGSASPNADIRFETISGGTLAERMRIRADGTTDFSYPVIIDTDNNAGGALRIEANQTNPEQDYYFAQEILSTLSGSQTVTGTREQGALFIDVNSSATGGTTTEEHRAFGILVDVDVTGDADNVYGIQTNATVTPTTGTVSNVYGGHFTGEDNGGAGQVSTLNGVYAIAIADNATSDPNTMYGGNFNCSITGDSNAVGVVNGLYSEVTINVGAGDATSTTHGVRTIIDNNTTQQTNTSFLFHGSYEGTLPTTPYGVYISSDVPNYFGGSLGIGTSSPSTLLHLSSTSPRITLTDTSTGADHRINADSSVGNLAFDVDVNSETASPSAVFNIKGSEKMRITSANTVDITGDINAVNNIYLASTIYHEGDVNTYMQFHSNDQWRVVTGGTEMLEINNSYILAGSNTVGKVHTDTNQGAGTHTPNLYVYNSFVWTLTGNITLGNPSTEITGMSGVFVFIHSGAGRTVSLGNQYRTVGGAGLTLSGEAGAVDLVPYFVRAGGIINLGTPQLAFA